MIYEMIDMNNHHELSCYDMKQTFLDTTIFLAAMAFLAAIRFLAATGCLAMVEFRNKILGCPETSGHYEVSSGRQTIGHRRISHEISGCSEISGCQCLLGTGVRGVFG